MSALIDAEPTGLQRLVLAQASLDVRTILDAALTRPANDPSWIDQVDAMSDERIAAALVTLAVAVVERPATLAPFARSTT